MPNGKIIHLFKLLNKSSTIAQVSNEPEVYIFKIDLTPQELEQLDAADGVVTRVMKFPVNSIPPSTNLIELIFKRELEHLSIRGFISDYNKPNYLFVPNEVRFIVEGNREMFQIKQFELNCKPAPKRYKAYKFESKLNFGEIKNLNDAKCLVRYTSRTVLADTPFHGLFPNNKGDYNLSKKYFLSDKFTDVTIWVGDTKFPAHRFVLSERSPVFETMFRSNLSENQKRTINIIDFDEEVVQKLLEYLYTGSCKILESTPSSLNPELILSLFEISDKYDVTDLKDVCAEILRGCINTGNVVKIYQVASLHNSPVLETDAKEFFITNKKEILPDPVALNNFIAENSASLVHELLV